MAADRSSRRPTFDPRGILGGCLAVLTLLVVVYYFSLYRGLPEHGFVLHSDTGEVLQVISTCPQSQPICLEVGDRVRQINNVSFERYLENDSFNIYKPFKGMNEIPMEIERAGRIHEINIRALADHRSGLSSLFTFAFPLLFWVMGTVAVIFLRPRDERWLLLILLHYDTALWVSSGMLSYSHEAYATTAFLISIVLFLPLSVHLHLILPDAPFRAYHRWVLPPLYLIAALLIILIQWKFIPRYSFYLSAVSAMSLSLGLLVVRVFLPAPSAARVARRVMLYGVGIVLGPIAVVTLFYYIDPVVFLGLKYINLILWVFLAVSPVWPLTYIYAIYKHDLGTFEFRANRLLGAYGFFATFVTFYIVAFTRLATWWPSGSDLVLFGLLFSLVFVVAIPPLYVRFQRMVDRRVFGIKYRPNEVVSAFAERIPTAFDMRVLKRVIVDEILPTLMIRQSAIYLFGESGVTAIYQQEVPAADLEPKEDELRTLASNTGRFVSFTSDASRPFGWVRLALPLSIPDRTIGLWLLGRRDPDDFYPASDIQLLTTLANQIGPVIENFRLVERARQEVAENRRLQEQLIHSQKMEAIGRLSAGVAHDFNNILSVIIGYSNLLLAQYRDDASLRQSVTNIKDAGERAAGLTKQLLAFSRQQVMEAQVTSVNAIVRDVEKMLRRLTGEDVELVTRLSQDLPRVKIDPGQLGQVIINLVVNARDAMPDGGRILLETQSVRCGDGGRACHDGVPSGQYAGLVVKDDGSGIDPEIQAHMFEPYFTTKEIGKGTGLGLSMVYGIVNQCKGFVFVDSAVGKGTTFSIYLPAASDTEIASEMARGARGALNVGTETVLLVEDEESVRAVTSEILQSNGYKVIEAQDGQQAIRVFKRHRGVIDLLLTDVVMPHMKGPELASHLVQLEPGLKVIYMSGYNEEAILGQRFGEGESVLIHKPFSPQTLAGKVRHVLDGTGFGVRT
jgi:signal transduction histidine kinase